MNDEDIEKIIEEYGGVLQSLSETIRCPECKKFVKGPFYNLGPEHHSFEGCKDCFVKFTTGM